MIRRREFLIGGAALAGIGLRAAPLHGAKKRFGSLAQELTLLEKDNGGRLGVAVLDTGSGELAGVKMRERFAMCSTFKLLLAAAVLARVDAEKESLDRAVAIPATGLLGNSPMTKEHAGGTMPVRALCEAILTRSDNTGANLLLETIGGPGGITKFARTLGDGMTRLDRTETSLNEARPGDPRDTTTPVAMLGNIRKLLLGKTLSNASREQLTQWLVQNKTGDERLRAHLPQDWRAGDKTGSSGVDTTNDVGILWPGDRPPLLVAAYLTECKGEEAKRNAVLAEVGRLVAAAYQG